MLLPNGVRHPVEGTSKEEREKFVVTMVARLSYQKDPQTFIRAAIALVERYDDIIFRLIGDGELSGAIEKQLKGSKNRERIELSGWMDDPNQAYLDAYLFICFVFSLGGDAVSDTRSNVLFSSMRCYGYSRES